MVSKAREKTVTYLFLARISNDIDHIVPIVSALLDDGVPASEIRYVSLLPHISINPGKDERAIYLARRGVQLEAPHLNNFRFKFLRELATIPLHTPLHYLLSRIGRRFYAKLVAGYADNLNTVNWKRILDVVNSMQENGCVVFDVDMGATTRELAKLCTTNNLHFVSVAHGFALHKGFTDPGVDRLLNNPARQKKSVFTHHIFPNPWVARRAAGNGLENFTVLGSTRFSPEWIQKLDRIYPPVAGKKHKLKVAAVIEKGGVYVDKSPCVFLDVDEQFRALRYLAEHDGIELRIKTNARGLYRTQANHLKGLIRYLEPEQTHTGQLFSWADVVVGCCSSVLLDAVMKKKPLVLLRHATHLKMSFFDENLGWQSRSFDDFRNMMDRLVQSTEHFAYDSAGYANIVNYYVYGNNAAHDVPQSYARFLRNLAHV
jgi:hypothetical protein